jgi:uncharacterized membrane protein YgdD (TMEM256/DUF423 family)
MYKTALVAGILFACLGVVLGAFGAHALKPLLSPEGAQTFETGVRYQMYHAFALLATGVLFANHPFKPLKAASVLFIVGIVLFSGSLYGLTALKIAGEVGLGGLGALTPIGGLLLIGGWITLLVGIMKKK